MAFGSTVFPLIMAGIFYGLELWLTSPKLLIYPLNLLGLIFIVPGGALALWCFSVIKTIPYEPILVNWGPWSRVRHPIYLAGILINFGIGVLIGTVLLILLSFAYAIAEILIDTIHEEKNLRKNLPKEYEEYSRKIPSWIPRIRKD